MDEKTKKKRRDTRVMKYDKVKYTKLHGIRGM